MHWRTRDSGSGTLGISLAVVDAFDAAVIVALVVVVEVSEAYAIISKHEGDKRERSDKRGNL